MKVEDPDPPQVDQREEAGGHDGEDGHRLGRAGDGVAPFRPHQVQDGGDQGAGVGDPDPEDEVGDVGAPADRVADARHAHAGADLVEPGQAEPGHARQQDAQGEDIAGHRRRQRPQGVVVDVAVGQFRHRSRL